MFQKAAMVQRPRGTEKPWFLLPISGGNLYKSGGTACGRLKYRFYFYHSMIYLNVYHGHQKLLHSTGNWEMQEDTFGCLLHILV